MNTNSCIAKLQPKYMYLPHSLHLELVHGNDIVLVNNISIE